MRLIINLALVALVALLIYALYDSIREPIAFKDVKETREQIVQEKLTKIRVAQEACIWLFDELRWMLIRCRRGLCPVSPVA